MNLNTEMMMNQEFFTSDISNTCYDGSVLTYEAAVSLFVNLMSIISRR